MAKWVQLEFDFDNNPPSSSEHAPGCKTQNLAQWKHNPTSCDDVRMLCQHRPQHTYGEQCIDYRNTSATYSEINRAHAGG